MNLRPPYELYAAWMEDSVIQHAGEYLENAQTFAEALRAAKTKYETQMRIVDIYEWIYDPQKGPMLVRRYTTPDEIIETYNTPNS